MRAATKAAEATHNPAGTSQAQGTKLCRRENGDWRVLPALLHGRRTGQRRQRQRKEEGRTLGARLTCPSWPSRPHLPSPPDRLSPDRLASPNDNSDDEKATPGRQRREGRGGKEGLLASSGQGLGLDGFSEGSPVARPRRRLDSQAESTRIFYFRWHGLVGEVLGNSPCRPERQWGSIGGVTASIPQKRRKPSWSHGFCSLVEG